MEMLRDQCALRHLCAHYAERLPPCAHSTRAYYNLCRSRPGLCRPAVFVVCVALLLLALRPQLEPILSICLADSVCGSDETLIKACIQPVTHVRGCAEIEDLINLIKPKSFGEIKLSHIMRKRYWCGFDCIQYWRVSKSSLQAKLQNGISCVINIFLMKIILLFYF